MVLFVVCKLILQTHNHVQPSSGARYLIFGLTLRLLSYVMCANSEGSGDKYHNLMRWLILLCLQTVEAETEPGHSKTSKIMYTQQRLTDQPAQIHAQQTQISLQVLLCPDSLQCPLIKMIACKMGWNRCTGR